MSSTNTFTKVFRVPKKAISRAVREEIRGYCAPVGNKNFKWPSECLVYIGTRIVRFRDLDDKFLIQITSEDHGFDSVRAYTLLVCEGCPASGMDVDSDACDDEEDATDVPDDQ
jgi:hypothetical protein